MRPRWLSTRLIFIITAQTAIFHHCIEGRKALVKWPKQATEELRTGKTHHVTAEKNLHLLQLPPTQKEIRNMCFGELVSVAWSKFESNEVESLSWKHGK